LLQENGKLVCSSSKNEEILAIQHRSIEPGTFNTVITRLDHYAIDADEELNVKYSSVTSSSCGGGQKVFIKKMSETV
jgi:hypothetical protein